MVHKRIKKAISSLRRGKKGDRLPDIPGPDPLLNVAAAAFGLTPVGRGVLAGYMLAENTEKYWGPPVEKQAQWTARQWEEYQNWYERNIRAQYAGSEIDPDSPLGYTPRRGMVATVAPKGTRKVTKANKATKMAWQLLTKGRKAKLTKSACQKLLKKCSMIASKANPNTKSRIGKAKNGTTKACKKIRKEIWGTTKRY